MLNKNPLVYVNVGEYIKIDTRVFSWHEKLVEKFECGTCFAKSYHSWERGLNENHNGLLRQFFSKQMAF